MGKAQIIYEVISRWCFFGLDRVITSHAAEVCGVYAAGFRPAGSSSGWSLKGPVLGEFGGQLSKEACRRNVKEVDWKRSLKS